MMTLDEMKLAVCEKLPELIDIDTISMTYPTYWWTMKGTSLHQIDWPTEGLQVCHEAEKLFKNDAELVEKYWLALYDVTDTTAWPFDATHEQRLEALCRVWFPERFQ